MSDQAKPDEARMREAFDPEHSANELMLRLPAHLAWRRHTTEFRRKISDALAAAYALGAGCRHLNLIWDENPEHDKQCSDCGVVVPDPPVAGKETAK